MSIKVLTVPHLPNGEVRHVIIGKKYKKMLKTASNKHNFELICLDSNPFVDSRLEGHVDLSAVHLGGNEIALGSFLKNSDAVQRLKALGLNIRFVPDCSAPQYPYDAALNFCIVGNTLIYNHKTAQVDIVNELTIAKTPIDCKQGYTKCSVCVADEESIITEDKGIASKAESAGLKVLLLDNAEIELDGFKSGFIGGASFKIAHNKMAFTGYIINSNVRNAIEGFLEKRGIETVYLTKRSAFDIGSAIPITEELI